jgi:hypothetical protein
MPEAFHSGGAQSRSRILTSLARARRGASSRGVARTARRTAQPTKGQALALRRGTLALSTHACTHPRERARDASIQLPEAWLGAAGATRCGVPRLNLQANKHGSKPSTETDSSSRGDGKLKDMDLPRIFTVSGAAILRRV